MTETLFNHYDAVSEYNKLLWELNLTKEDIKALNEYNYYLKNPHLYKRCKRCGTIKPTTEFYKNILKSKGVFDYCKECAKKRQRELRCERQRNNRADNSLCKTA